MEYHTVKLIQRHRIFGMIRKIICWRWERWRIDHQHAYMQYNVGVSNVTTNLFSVFKWWSLNVLIFLQAVVTISLLLLCVRMLCALLDSVSFGYYAKMWVHRDYMQHAYCTVYRTIYVRIPFESRGKLLLNIFISAFQSFPVHVIICSKID